MQIDGPLIEEPHVFHPWRDLWTIVCALFWLVGVLMIASIITFAMFVLILARV